MALFGFAINFINGRTDYVIVSAVDSILAERKVVNTLDNSFVASVETVETYDAEAIVQEQYNACAVLSSQFKEDSDD